MTKIGILAFVEKSGGGIYQYTESMIDALKSDNSRKYIIFCKKNDNRFDNLGLEVRKIDISKWNFFRQLIMMIQLMLFVRKPLFFSKKELNIFSDIDIFISPTNSAYPHFYLDRPFIFTLHDMQEMYYPEFFSFKERFKRLINNRALSKFSKTIICESTYVKNDIVKFLKVKSNNIAVIQSPPPQKFLDFNFKGNKFVEVKRKYNLPNKYIFYPAQFWYHKNHLKLLEAFKILSLKYPDLYLVLTGAKQNNYKNVIKKIKELNLDNKVYHLGYVNYEELPYIYKMALMLVMPSLFESISIPIYEAFALKVPVCSSNVTALPEQVGDAGLLFDPNDVDDMVNKIELFLNDEELRKVKAQKGYNKIKCFDHNRYREELLKLLNRFDKNV